MTIAPFAYAFGCLVTNNIHQILLLRSDNGTWSLPAVPGFTGERAESTALRAVREATGLTGDITGLVGELPPDPITGSPLQRIYKFALATNSPPITPAQKTVGWFHSDNLPGVTPTTAALLRRYAPKRPLLPRDEWLATTPRSWTCAAAIITSPDGRLLLVKAPEATSWNFVGGMIDAHETGPQAATRELLEETGIDRPARRLLVVAWQHPEPNIDHSIIQFFHDFGTIEPESVNLCCEDGEIVEWGWFHPHDLDSATGPARADLARKALSARCTTEISILDVPGLSQHSTATTK